MHNGSSSQTGTRYSNFFRSGLQAVSRERSRSFAFAPPTHTLPLTHIAIPQLNQRPLPPLPPLPPKDASPSIDDPSFTRRKVTVSGFSFVKRLKTFTKDFRLSLVLTKPISGKRRVEPVQTLRRKGSIRDRSFLTFDGPESPPTTKFRRLSIVTSTSESLPRSPGKLLPRPRNRSLLSFGPMSEIAVPTLSQSFPPPTFLLAPVQSGDKWRSNRRKSAPVLTLRETAAGWNADAASIYSMASHTTTLAIR